MYPVLFCWLFLGRRQSAGELSLFAAKKRRKNRHRFEAVDADQGCGRRIGTAGLFASFWSQKEGPNGWQPFARQPKATSGKKKVGLPRALFRNTTPLC